MNIKQGDYVRHKAIGDISFVKALDSNGITIETFDKKGCIHYSSNLLREVDEQYEVFSMDGVEYLFKKG